MNEQMVNTGRADDALGLEQFHLEFQIQRIGDIGSVFVCKDGPVFSYLRLKEPPDEF